MKDVISVFIPAAILIGVGVMIGHFISPILKASQSTDKDSLLEQVKELESEIEGLRRERDELADALNHCIKRRKES